MITVSLQMLIVFGALTGYQCLVLPSWSGSSPKPKTMTSGNGNPKCEQYYFYDHGTDKCEFCCDICCHAEIKDTATQCEDECQEYAQKLKDEAANKQNDAQDLQSPKAAEDSDWMNLPLSAQVAVFAIIGAILFLLVILVFAKRKAIVGWFRHTAPDPAAVPDPAAMPLTTSHQQLGESGETTRDLLSLTATLARQQTAKINPSESDVLKYPTPESMEGQQGPNERVLC